jgi:peptidoglycan/LPS O-acetylase OafA/YrhL
MACVAVAAMNRQTSIKLDLIRWLAALLVFGSHFLQVGTALVDPRLIDSFSHLGVMVFFILSGYVIRYVAEGHHTGPRDYLEARWARINSVFLPALLVTVLFDTAGAHLAPSLYMRFPRVDPAHISAMAPIFLTFLYENAFHELRWFSNGPLWSVAFEVWYYIIFCAFFYFRGRSRWLLTCLAALLAGFHILLLFPLWLAGCALYKARDRIAAAPLLLRRLACALSFVAIILSCIPVGHTLLDPLRVVGEHITRHGYHSGFLADYVVGIPVLIFLGSLCSPGVVTVPEGRLSQFIRYNANFSFSLYAFHLPIVMLIRALGIYDVTNPVQAFGAAVFAIAICWLFSLVTERRKTAWRSLAQRGAHLLERTIPGLSLLSHRLA